MVHHLGPELFSGNVAEKQGQIIMIQRNPPQISSLQKWLCLKMEYKQYTQISPFKWTHDNKPLHFEVCGMYLIFKPKFAC